MSPENPNQNDAVYGKAERSSVISVGPSCRLQHNLMHRLMIFITAHIATIAFHPHYLHPSTLTVYCEVGSDEQHLDLFS